MQKWSSLKWRHNERDGVSNHQPHDCLLIFLFKAQIKENTKAPCHCLLWGEFTGDRWIPPQKASNAEDVSIWWRHHDPWFSAGYNYSYTPLPHRRVNTPNPPPPPIHPPPQPQPPPPPHSHTHTPPQPEKNKMAAMIFSDEISWMEKFSFWLEFHWSLFLRVH